MPAPDDTVFARVGVVGAGQLALMMAEAAPALGISLVVLADHETDPAVALCADHLVGAANDETALRALAERCDVITFDHELVDLELLARLEADGVVLRPGPRALAFSVDKAFQRRRFAAAGLPVPRFVVTRSPEEMRDFAAAIATPLVLKRARGGYDGRGVALPDDLEAAAALLEEWARDGEVVVEERLDLVGEAAQIVATDPRGTYAHYPLVRTVQHDGMCVETQFPDGYPSDLVERCGSLTDAVAREVGAVGLLAVEYFITEDGPMINEVALRPHNTGHWTIEGAETSQFEQHLRAVSGRPLGPVGARANASVMVNVVGADTPSDPARARALTGVAVHDYAKAWRPGRKLGHVTVVGDDVAGCHVRAWEGARAYGTAHEEA